MAGRSFAHKPSYIPERVVISREGSIFDSVPSIPASRSMRTRVLSEVRLNLSKEFLTSSRGVVKSSRSLVKSRSNMPLIKLKCSTKKAKYEGILDSGRPKHSTTRRSTRVLDGASCPQRINEGSPTVSFNRASPERFLSSSNRPTSTSSPLQERPSTRRSARKLDSIIGDCSQFEHKAHKLYSQLSSLKRRIKRSFREVKDNSQSPEPKFARNYMKNFVSDFRKDRATVVYGKKFQVVYMTNLKASA
jgi:hypothetical protein